ncbi:hypothetical protein ACO03_05030 [Pantoea ananatis]|nr:hypothetical protein ACO03_05030 [Pantoea ananatis]
MATGDLALHAKSLYLSVLMPFLEIFGKSMVEPIDMATKLVVIVVGFYLKMITRSIDISFH